MRKYQFDYGAIQAYYDAGHTIADCKCHFGISHLYWDYLARQGHIKVEGYTSQVEARKRFIRDMEAGKAITPSNLRRRFAACNFVPYACCVCSVSTWEGKPLTLHLHHRDGNNMNNRLDNLCLLCPNCHSQTETYGWTRLHQYKDDHTKPA